MSSRVRLAGLGERPERPAEIVDRVVRLFRDRLPPGWSAMAATGGATADRRADALLTVTDQAQTEGYLVVEAKRSVAVRDLESVARQVSAQLANLPATAVPMLVAAHLSPSVRAWLEERGFSYGDATGNLHVRMNRPALFLHDVGVEQDPWRGPGRPIGTLIGLPAARVVRALVDFSSSVSVPELARRSGASLGATYRVVDFLDREALVRRTPRGPVTHVEWRRLLLRWSADYGFLRSNRVAGYLQPRGVDAVLAGLAADSPPVRYAVTGSAAIQHLAAYAPVRAAMIYTDAEEQLAAHLGLRAVDSGANVLLAVAGYDVVFDRLVASNGLELVAPSQAAVDLLTGPGRNPAEAEALLDWMEAHEREWRC